MNENGEFKPICRDCKRQIFWGQEMEEIQHKDGGIEYAHAKAVDCVP